MLTIQRFEVTPIYYVFFTTFVIMASGILFKEWDKLGALDVVGNVCGFLIIILGIFQMQLFKDLNLTLNQVHTLSFFRRPDPATIQLRHVVGKRSDSEVGASVGAGGGAGGDRDPHSAIPLLTSTCSVDAAAALPRRTSFSDLPEGDRPLYHHAASFAL